MKAKFTGQRNNQRKSQNGMSIMGFVIILVVVGLFGLLFLKLFPPFFDNLKIDRGLDRLAEEEGVSTMSKREIIGRLNKILYIDYAHQIVDLNKALDVQRRDRSTEIHVDYEVVVPVVLNVSALIDFKNDVVVARSQ